MSAIESQISCGGCGKSVPWKPEYVGKRLRCKCGFVIVGPPAAPARVTAPAAKAANVRTPATAPKAKPAAPPPPPPKSDADVDDFDALVAQAEEYAVAEEATKPKAKPARPAAVAATAGGPTSPMLAYARAVPRKVDDAAESAMVHDVYIPLALLVVGVLARFYDGYVRGLHNPALMTVFVAITCTINLILIFAALLIAVKLLDLGLGNIGPAMLKIAAVALLPAAIGDMIRYYTFAFVAWPMTLLMYYALLYYLFQMDGGEMRIVVAIIWLIQTWVGFLILALLFSTMGMGLRGSAHGGSVPLGSGGTHLVVSNGMSSSDDNQAPGPDELAAKEIHDGTAVEFTQWIKPDLHGVMHGTRQMALDQADKYYAAGAKAVWAMKIQKMGGQMEVCHEMVIELPTKPAARKAVRKAIYGFDMPEPTDGSSSEEGKRFIHLSLE
jgi:hypothetical protein